MLPARSWIVSFWSGVFGAFGRISIFHLICLLLPRRRVNAGFVEGWVFLNSFAAVAALVYATHSVAPEASVLFWLVFIYAAMRAFEVFIYQANVLLFDEYRARRAGKSYAVHGYRRIVILLLHNYFELVCWFGVMYVFFYRNGDLAVGPGQPDPTFYSVFRDSLLLMFSFNADRYSPAGDLGLFIFSVHATIGIFMTVLVFARFLSLLPTPASKDPSEGR